MPVEIIGEFGTPGAELEWLQAQGRIAIRHLQKICGDPPPEMELEIVWQEHDLGTYPTIALTWEDGMRGAPWPHISRCQSALAAYEDGEEPPHWSAPCDFDGDSEEDADWENPKSPVDPPTYSSLLDLHRHVSKLIEYAVRAPSQANRKPRLVEKEDDDIPESALHT